MTDLSASVDRVAPYPRQAFLALMLAIVSTAVVFAAAAGSIPADHLPTAPRWVIDAIPHLNVGLSLLAITTITAGWRSIRHGRIDRHRALMLTATLTFAGFLILYLYRLVVLGGPAPFPGPEIAYQSVYLPFLVVHIGLAICSLPFVWYALLLGLTLPVPRLPETPHAQVGRLAATLWLIAFASGIGVYLQLYWMW